MGACEQVSRFPAVERDFARVVEDVGTGARIAACAEAPWAPLMRNVAFQSAFRDPQVGAGIEGIAFRMEHRATDRTLMGDEADRCTRAVAEAPAIATGGGLRA